MILKTRLFGHTYQFKSLREVMAKANEEKSGDQLAGIAAESAEERVAAKIVLSEITLQDVRNTPPFVRMMKSHESFRTTSTRQFTTSSKA